MSPAGATAVAAPGSGGASRTAAKARAALVPSYLDEARAVILDEIRAITPASSRHTGRLYELILDYPLREAKALRPAICIATCRALGGRLEGVLRSAAMLELFHNAFLIHDDVEDDSERRRGGPTLHREHGIPTAVNVGDGMLACALQPLLDNTRLLGLGPALRILEVVARMTRESAEGQAMELEWIRSNRWDLTDRDYVRMVYKKTAWYSFVAPVEIGAITAGAPTELRAALRRFAMLVGVAFQIHDDVLNLTGSAEVYGKEICGDLWEGKHTLMLMHALRSADGSDRARGVAVLGRRRPGPTIPGDADDTKSVTDVEFLMALVQHHGSVAHARAAARRRALRAQQVLDSLSTHLADSSHRDFLAGLADFVIDRER